MMLLSYVDSHLYLNQVPEWLADRLATGALSPGPDV